MILAPYFYWHSVGDGVNTTPVYFTSQNVLMVPTLGWIYMSRTISNGIRTHGHRPTDKRASRCAIGASRAAKVLTKAR